MPDANENLREEAGQHIAEYLGRDSLLAPSESNQLMCGKFSGQRTSNRGTLVRNQAEFE